MLIVYIDEQVELEVINTLDEMMICEARGDDEYKQLFSAMYVLVLLTFAAVVVVVVVWNQ